jgi:hypothetical protein
LIRKAVDPGPQELPPGAGGSIVREEQRHAATIAKPAIFAWDRAQVLWRGAATLGRRGDVAGLAAMRALRTHGQSANRRLCAASARGSAGTNTNSRDKQPDHERGEHERLEGSSQPQKYSPRVHDIHRIPFAGRSQCGLKNYESDSPLSRAVARSGVERFL